MKPIIIAIDGYSSCGKSTLAKEIAKKLNYAYVDTGAMYRAVTLYFIQNKLNISELSEEEIDLHINNIDIDFRYNSKSMNSDTYLNDENVEQTIRGKEVSNEVSIVSQSPVVRKRMVSLQQNAGKKRSLVMDGRDIGTVVFPNAELKIFMTASPKIRAERRYNELISNDQNISMQEVVANLEKRDFNDTNRKENPLKQAEDAWVLDNSLITKEEQLRIVLQKIEEVTCC